MQALFDKNRNYVLGDPELEVIGDRDKLAQWRHKGVGPAYYKLGRKIKGPVKLTEGMHTDQLGIAGCHGHWARGTPISRGKGQFFDDLIITNKEHTDSLTQGSDACVKVKVYKAAGRD